MHAKSIITIRTASEFTISTSGVNSKILLRDVETLKLLRFKWNYFLLSNEKNLHFCCLLDTLFAVSIGDEIKIFASIICFYPLFSYLFLFNLSSVVKLPAYFAYILVNVALNAATSSSLKMRNEASTK